MIKNLNYSERRFISGGTSDECECSSLDYLLPATANVIAIAAGATSFASAVFSLYSEEKMPFDAKQFALRKLVFRAGAIAIAAEMIAAIISY